MKRKLATIQKVLSVEKHPDADKLDILKVLGWTLVSESGNFKPGDWCVYFEIDSFITPAPIFEFLRKSSLKRMMQREGFRLKTMRLRGILSQGLAMPLKDVLEAFPNMIQANIVEGEDVSDLLGVEKYETPIPACLEGIKRGDTPGWMVTDETRVQLLQGLLDKYKGEMFYKTEKLDGSSVTYFLDRNDDLHVCSRLLDLVEDDRNSMWKWARENKVEQVLRVLKEEGENIALQGEIIGEGIQGNKYKIRGQQVRLFNVVDMDNQKYLNFFTFKEVIEDGCGFETVPIVWTNFELPNNIDELVADANGKMSALNSQTQIEGYVWRPMVEKTDIYFETPHARVSFKVINPKFLLKYDE